MSGAPDDGTSKATCRWIGPHCPGGRRHSRDQLYLALRLAYLEEYATQAEPAPFIGDDLFATFDEERTKNGLTALAAIGDVVQTIVFTHHRHVAEIASANLGADACLLKQS
jgi:uncharacterized protein YhaN